MIDSCVETAQGFRVKTTGADFELRPSGGEVLFGQRIGRERHLGRLHIGAEAMAGLRLASEDKERVVFETASGVRIEVHCDSVVRVDSPEALALVVTGEFEAEYFRAATGATLALDEWGGMGAYFCDRHPVRAETAQTKSGFSIRQELARGNTFLLCVCPPREYDWRKHNEERIVHFFPEETRPGYSARPLPKDEELEGWQQIAKVLVLHLEPWDFVSSTRINLLGGIGVSVAPKQATRYCTEQAFRF